MGNSHDESNEFLNLVKQPNTKFRFFWQVNEDSFNESLPKWVPFNSHDNELLEKSYQNFIKGNEIKLIIDEYTYDFENWIQININDLEIRTPIKRDLASNVTNIFRKNRFQESSIISDNMMINIGNILDEVECEFKVIPNKNIKFKVPNHLNFFNRRINIEFLKYIELLSNEITQLSIRLNLNNIYQDIYLDKITEKNFFSSILKMYSEESFLYKKVNKILKAGNSDDYILIKYYFISLLASFQFCSQKYCENLKTNLHTSNYKLFWSSKISFEEIKLYTNSKNIFRINIFLSTSYEKEKAISYLDENDGCLFEIEIYDNYCFNNLILMEDHSVFENEKEVVIKSGSLLLIKKFETIENHHFCQMSLISDSYQGLKVFIENNKVLNYIDLNSNNLREIGAQHISEALIKDQILTTIYLSGNNLREIGAQHISIALKKNQTLTNINLSSNNLGEIGAKYISEALLENQTLTNINLSSNNLGEIGSKHISEALKKNQTLTNINLSSNNLGEIGSKHISEALKKNQKLIKIYLDKDDIILNENFEKRISYNSNY